MLRTLILLAALAFAPGARADVFVLFGGYNTCPGSRERTDRPLEEMTLWEPFERLVLQPAHQEGRLQPYILACLGVSQGKPRDRQLYLRIRDSFGVERKTTLAPDAQAFRREDFEPAIQAIAHAVLLAAGDGSAESVVMVGHSYGGWTLAEVSLRIGSRLPVALFTLDPISPETCSPYLYRRSGLRIPSGCRQAPAEWEGALGARVLEATLGRWWNLYQNQFAWNHSGPVAALEEAGQNRRVKVEVDLRTGLRAWNQHSRIARDPETWRWILLNRSSDRFAATTLE